MPLFSFKSSQVIGVDLGHSAIKILKGSLSKNCFHVDELVLQPIDRSWFQHSRIQQSLPIETKLKEIVSKHFKPNSTYSTGIKGSLLMNKRVLMPKVPKKEIPQQVRWEAAQVFPADLKNILVDHQIIGESDSLPLAPPGTAAWDILLVGAPQEQALELKRLFEKVKMNLSFIDFELFSLGRSMHSILPSKDKSKIVAFVDVGASATRVCVSQNQKVYFMKEFPIAGDAFTETLAQSLSLSFSDAEALKVHNDNDIPTEAKDVLIGRYRQWLSQLQLCEDAYMSQSSQGVIDEWAFVGGGMKSPGFEDFLNLDSRISNKRINLNFEKFLKSKNKKIDKELLRQWAPRLMSAVGLCIEKGV